MIVDAYSLGELQTNCYIIADRDRCLIIDPADEGDFIASQLIRSKIEPEAILLTHGHFDHMLSSGELQMIYSIPVIMHIEDMFLIKRSQSTVNHFFKRSFPIIIPNITSLPTGNSILDEFGINTMHTPGHTPGSCCYYMLSQGWMLTGDTFFEDGVGGADHSYSNVELLKKSVEKIMGLPDETIIYPGHGQSFILGDVKGSQAP